MTDPMTKVEVVAQADGALTYYVDHRPAALPAVRGRDLQAAWETAREAARRGAWSGARGFRFRREDGGWSELALLDADAQCWAGAVDRAIGMQTGYGLSVCLRLLALIELLGRARWAAGLVQFGGRGAELHPALLRLAAETPLADDARFDEGGLRARLAALPGHAISAGE